MLIIKYIIISIIFAICFVIGNYISKKYILRVNELNELNSAFNIIESKIKFTYESLSEIFLQVSKMLCPNISQIFLKTSTYIKEKNAEEAWNTSLNECKTNLKEEDIENIKNFGKMLGKTDKDGQVNNIILTKTLIKRQIDKALEEEHKNSKLYKTLGTIVGLAIVIILI